MDVSNTCVVNGSLQISTEVIAKIARMAALEIEGVKEVSPATAGVKGLLSKSKSVAVSLNDDVAELTLQVVVFYGAKIPSVCEKVQKNVKAAVQSMTSITVSRVNVIVDGVQVRPEVAAVQPPLAIKEPGPSRAMQGGRSL